MSWSGWRNILSVIGLLLMLVLWASDGKSHKSTLTDWKKLKPFQADLEFWSKRKMMRGAWKEHFNKKITEDFSVIERVNPDPIVTSITPIQSVKNTSILPFRYLGRFHNESRNVIFVMLGKNSISLKEGDSIEEYQLAHINEHEAEFTYIPTNKKVFLTFSKGSH